MHNYKSAGTNALVKMKKNPLSSAISTLTVLLPCIFTPQVFSEEGQRYVIEEVIVTARKRSESIQDVPVAITAFSADKLKRYGIDSIEQIAAMTPQLAIGSQSTQTGGSITLRGVGAGTDNPATDQAVSINIDGVQISQANVLRLGQFDLRQVEILKGPQALFFGKNSPGGVIAFKSNSPGEEFESQIRVAYNFDRDKTILSGFVSGPLTDSFAARLAVQGSEEDGWKENIAEAINIPGLSVPAAASKDAEAQDEIFARLTLMFTPNDTFDAEFKISYGNVERDKGSVSAAAQISVCSSGSAQLGAFPATGGLVGIEDDCELDDTVIIPRAEPALAALNPEFGDGTPYWESTQLLSSFKFNYKLTEELTLTSVTGYYNLEEDSFANFGQTDLSLVHAASLLENTQITQEVRIQSDFSGDLNFMAGVFYQDAELTNLIPVAIGTQGAEGIGLSDPFMLSLPDWIVETESLSVFGQVTYNILPEWELSVGARWTDEDKELGGTDFGAPLDIDPNYDSISNSDTSVEITTKYDFAEDHMLYAGYKEGFISGGFNITAQQATGPGIDSSFDPSTVTGFELGVKGTSSSGRFQYNAALYSYDYEDMQLSSFDPDTLSLTTLNAGEATVEGVEFSGTYLFESIEGLTANASITYNDAQYDEFIASCYSGQSIAAGCSLNPNPDTGEFQSQDLSGETMVRAPEWAGAIGATYDIQVTAGLGLSVSALANYTSEYNGHGDLDPRAVQDSYWIYNANITLYDDGGRWEVALIGKNLTDELVAISTRSRSFGGSGTGTNNAMLADLSGIVGAPREVVLDFTYNF